MKGKLYIVATPIGNIADISFRAVDILRSVHLIAAEDTRHSQRLLAHYGITTPLMSYHQHNEAERIALLLQRLKEGQDIALISDAGTPLISDPGYPLVNAVKAAEFDVVPIPGACALITALCASGMPASSFRFMGFLPAKTLQRQHYLERLREDEDTLIFYEAPHRIVEMLQACQQSLGVREYCLAKELTKHFETLKAGPVQDLIAWLEEDPLRQQGEFVVIASPPVKQAQALSERATSLLEKLLPHLPLKLASQIVSETFGENKQDLYQHGLSKKSIV